MAAKRGFQDLGFVEMCGSPVGKVSAAPFRADISNSRADVSMIHGNDEVQTTDMPSHALDPQSCTPLHASVLQPLDSHTVSPLHSLDSHAAAVSHALDNHAHTSDMKNAEMVVKSTIHTTDVASNLHASVTAHSSPVKITTAVNADVRADETKIRADVGAASEVIASRADAQKVSGSNLNTESCGQPRGSVWDRLQPKIANEDVKLKSFAAIVGGVPEPELEFFPVKEESDKRVHIPVTLMKDMVNTYRTVLLGYFLGPRVSYQVVLRAVTKAWGKYGFIDAMVNVHGFFFFRFNDEGGCMHVVDSPPLLINGIPLFVTQWDPSKGLFRPVHTTCPLWVKLYNIPLVAFNREGISRIASALGIPLRMDACTASTCDKLWGRTSFAKVLINVWAKGELKREVEVVIPKLSGEGEDVVKVVVEYEWEPSQCSICKVFGHTDMVCGKGDVRNESATKVRGKQIQKNDADGFQLPRRKQWKPKISTLKGDKELVETSNTKTGNLKTTEDTTVGVGTVKRIMKPNGKEAEETNKEGKNTTLNIEGGFCTIHAGSTPGTKEGGVIGKEGSKLIKMKQGQEPFLKSVVETFKKFEQAKRGKPLATSNTFDVLSSDESDEENVEDVATGEKQLEEPGIAVNISQ